MVQRTMSYIIVWLMGCRVHVQKILLLIVQRKRRVCGGWDRNKSLVGRLETVRAKTEGDGDESVKGETNREPPAGHKTGRQPYDVVYLFPFLESEIQKKNKPCGAVRFGVYELLDATEALHARGPHCRHKWVCLSLLPTRGAQGRTALQPQEVGSCSSAVRTSSCSKSRHMVSMRRALKLHPAVCDESLQSADFFYEGTLIVYVAADLNEFPRFST